MYMLEVFFVFLEALLMLSITCIQTFFYYKTIGLNKNWRGLRLVIVIILVSVIEAALQLVSVNISSLSWTGNLLYVIFILYPMLFMGGKYKERIFFGIVNLSIFSFSILFTSIILFPSKLVLYTSESTWQALLLLCTIIVFLYAALSLIIAHFSTGGKRYMPYKYWIGMIIFFSIIFIGFAVVNYLKIWVKDLTMFRIFLTVSTLGFFIIWLLSYFIFYFVCQYFSKSTEAAMLVFQNDMIERYMLRKQVSDERIRILSHDLKHSLTQWRTLAEEKGDTNALLNITEYEGQLNSSLMINVENENANAIINQKYWEAKQGKIEFLIEGVFHKDLLINKLDLCSLLGNLLDNAIEAAMLAETESLRCVKLSIKRKGSLLILSVENGYGIEPVMENGFFITRKKEKELHAIGMRSIKHVAEKYDGVVHNSYGSNWFKATVMLSGYQTILSDKK